MAHEGSGYESCEHDLEKYLQGAFFGRGIAVYEADAAKTKAGHKQEVCCRLKKAYGLPFLRLYRMGGIIK